MNLQDLEKEEADLMKLLSDNRQQQRDIHTGAFLSKYGIKIGDTIEFMDGKEKVTGIFSAINYSGVKANYPYVMKFKSDGEPGKREKRCWWSQLDTIKLVKPA